MQDFIPIIKSKFKFIFGRTKYPLPNHGISIELESKLRIYQFENQNIKKLIESNILLNTPKSIPETYQWQTYLIELYLENI